MRPKRELSDEERGRAHHDAAHSQYQAEPATLHSRTLAHMVTNQNPSFPARGPGVTNSASSRRWRKRCVKPGITLEGCHS
jgi:hypothetical protein